MQVYAALYHTFMPPLCAGSLYQGLYQVYATRALLGFIPGRRGDRRLPLVGSVRKSGRPHRWGISAKSPQGPALYQTDRQVIKTCNIYSHLPNHHNIPRVFYQPSVCKLSNMFPSSAPRPRGSQRQPWPLGRSPLGRSFS